MNKIIPKHIFILISLLFVQLEANAQSTSASAKIDAQQIVIGDQARLFLEAQHNTKEGKLVWAIFPETFNKLEVVEKGKIDTVKQGDIITLKQRLLITGFDSGLFTIPPATFTVVPNSGTPYTVVTDSFRLSVQTIAVDTTQPFKPIKEIIFVQSSWLDYIWYIIGVVIFLVLVAVIIIYFVRNKKAAAPVIVPAGPVETLQEKYLRLLGELDQKQLWQAGQVKEYYIELTDILRNYIEVRFRTPALELTTDEIIQQARRHKEMVRHIDLLRTILETADLAKFAKAQPLPQEHIDTMEYTRQFVNTTKPVVTETPPQS